ncbi:MAG TPA: zf-HC2 domain-containing protein [Kribbella sp.]|nr:zf-HC2 domain-containing protein [Kribbella sp.]
MSEHDRSQLGAYALGALEPHEARAVDEHLATCDECREELAGFEELKDFLSEVPAEAFLEGPPEYGDLLLQRTLREVRAESAAAAVEPHAGGPAEPRRLRWLLAAAAVVVIAGTSIGGVLVGRQTVDQYAVPAVTTPVGTRHGTATDAGTGTTMAATVEPRAGWSWVDVKISGLTAGAECVLRVTDKSGKSWVAGSWLVSEKAARDGSKFSGGVLVPVDQVKSVDVVTVKGERVVSAPI